MRAILLFRARMSAARIEQAMARINAAMARIDTAHAEGARVEDTAPTSAEPAREAEPQNSARVMALVNAHEKLREEVADTIGELDALIEELEA